MVLADLRFESNNSGIVMDKSSVCRDLRVVQQDLKLSVSLMAFMRGVRGFSCLWVALSCVWKHVLPILKLVP